MKLIFAFPLSARLFIPAIFCRGYSRCISFQLIGMETSNFLRQSRNISACFDAKQLKVSQQNVQEGWELQPQLHWVIYLLSATEKAFTDLSSRNYISLYRDLSGHRGAVVWKTEADIKLGPVIDVGSFNPAQLRKFSMNYNPRS